MRKPSRALLSRNSKTLKFKRPLQQIEKPCRAETLQNVNSLEGLTSDETRTAEGFVIFSFGK